ncbi:MAG: hypothetical protein H6747_09615 [Deltaproteobacteria bacterium]|nr:hypothetical protein [Deltaproteobacteria bacterium]
MANDLAKVKTTAFTSFSEALAAAPLGALAACRLITTDTANLSLGTGIGTGTWSVAGATEASPTDIDTVKVELASVNFEIVEMIKWHDINDNPDIVAQRAALLANRGAATIRDAVSTGILGLFTLAHPMELDRGILAGTKYIDGSIEFDGGPATQSNLLGAAALSQSTFATARKTLRGYKGQDGVVLGMGERVKLIVGEDHADVAYEIANSGVTSAALQASANKAGVSDVVVIPGLSTKWFMADEVNNPLIAWMRKMPQIDVRESATGLGVTLAGTATFTFGVTASEAGIVGANF